MFGWSCWRVNLAEANAAGSLLNAGDLEAGIPKGTRQQLLEGTWDATQVLLDAGDQIEKTAAALPY